MLLLFGRPNAWLSCTSTARLWSLCRRDRVVAGRGVLEPLLLLRRVCEEYETGVKYDDDNEEEESGDRMPGVAGAEL